MTTTAAVLFGLTLVVAVVDWWAVAKAQRSVELVAKPLTMVVLIAAALALDVSDTAVQMWIVAALVFSLGGDVFLMFAERGENWFIAGLASFLIGHLAYVAGFWASGEVEISWFAIGFVVVVIALATLGQHIMSGVRREAPEMVPPVAGYIAVISAMVASAIGTANPWAIAGSLLFYASDATIAWNKFLEPRPHGRIAIIVTYHLGQIGLVLFLV